VPCVLKCMHADLSLARFLALKTSSCLWTSLGSRCALCVIIFAGCDNVSSEVAAGIHSAEMSPARSMVENLLAIAGCSIFSEGTDGALATALQQAEDAGHMPDIRLTVRALWREASSTGSSAQRLQALGSVGWHPLVRALPPAGDAFEAACREGDADMVRVLLGVGGWAAGDVSRAEQGGFETACRGGHLDVVRHLLALTGDRRVDVHAEEEYAFRMACYNGRLAVVRELLALTGDRRVDVHAEEEYAFLMECYKGHVAVVRELLALSGDRCVDVYEGEECAFRVTCFYGQVKVMRELLALSGDRRVDVHAMEEWAFRMACRHGRLDVVRELLGLTGDRCPSSKPTCALDNIQLRAVQAALASGVSHAQWGAPCHGGRGGCAAAPACAAAAA